MIEKIATNVSYKLNDSPSRNFEGMVGLESHLGKIQSSLHLEKDGPMTLGVSGPENFPIDISLKLPRKVRGMFVVIHYDHGSKLFYKNNFLSHILNQSI